MTSERDELLRLVREMPDEDVVAVLAIVRRRLRPAARSSWPPAFFGSIRSERDDDSERVDEILAEGFAGGGRTR